MSMRLFFLVLLFAVASRLALAAPADAIIARVNGEVIMLSQLREAALDQDVSLSDVNSEGLRNHGYRRALTALVDEALLVQFATKNEVKTDDAVIARDVDKMLQELERQLGSHDALDKFLKDHSLSFDEFRDMLSRREKRRTMSTEVIARRVKNDAASVAEFQKKCIAENKPTEMVRVSQILIAVKDGGKTSEAGRKAYKTALSLARKAEGDTGAFGELARKNSADAASRTADGDLGWADPNKLRPELRAAIATLEDGDISEPIWADDGWHVLMLSDRRNIRDLYFTDAFAKERARLLEQLRTQASIKIYNPDGSEGK